MCSIASHGCIEICQLILIVKIQLLVVIRHALHKFLAETLLLSVQFSVAHTV